MQLVQQPRKMPRIIAWRWRGTWEGVHMATWCSMWICRRGGGLVHHRVIIPPTLTLLLLLGAAVRRALTILPIDRFCTRFSSFWILQFFQLLAYRKWKLGRSNGSTFLNCGMDVSNGDSSATLVLRITAPLPVSVSAVLGTQAVWT